jgi:hypothetical protein
LNYSATISLQQQYPNGSGEIMILIPKYNSMVELSGSLSIIVTDTITNTIKQELYVPNAVVFTGKTFIASRIVGTSKAIMSHMGIGTGSLPVDTGTTVALPGNTALGAELTIGTNNYSRATTTVASFSGNVITYSSNFAAQNPNAPVGGVELREAGIFNASSAGDMLCRTVFPIVTKLPADALTITWTVTIQ